ncbi:hypothetical protein RB595_004506 [Gaeumannomyces hyphopodioides]
MYLSMSPPNPRKRALPDSGPVAIPVQPYQSPYASPPDQFSRWNPAGSDADFVVSDSSKPTTPTIPPFIMSAPNQFQSAQGFPQPAPTTSNVIARRPAARALVPTAGRPQYDGLSDPWPSFGDDGALIPQPVSATPVDENDNIQLLEEKAARAKRDAQANRKQIPPFVQKLSSFLEEAKNTELIRWSQQGDSFIVLDEDEFAKTLIPELFKHNNYASFVRQLNMYGFHKRVGLSDNSMKASERKNKSPSEYYNPYFKRGHPNLLWLINKPKNGGSKKKGKKDDGDGDSEEDVATEDTHSQAFVGPAQPGPARPAGSAADASASALQKKDLQIVRDQVGQLRNQQRAIHDMIQRLRSDHNQLYQQAVAFQNMHERHENSINAILNFLANVFRKSLEEQGGSHSVSDLLASIIPSANMPQGSVVDLGDFVHRQAGDHANTASPPKRPQRLLPPIPRSGPASIATSSPASAASPAYGGGGLRMGQVTELLDLPTDASAAEYLKHSVGSPQEQMMRIINDTNAGAATGIDLSDVAAKTPVTMNSDQRNQVINIMARQASVPKTTSPSVSATMATAGLTSTPASSKPPPMPIPSRQTKATPPPPPQPRVPASAPPGCNSLSPVMSSLTPPPPLLDELGRSQAELEVLHRLQEDQDHKIDELTHILGPLSPSGQIPGIDDVGNPANNTSNSYFPENIDIDQFLDPSAFANPLGGFDGTDFAGVNPMDGDEFNFSLDAPFDGGAGVAAQHGGIGPGMTMHNGTPSPAATEEIFRNDIGDNSAPEPKRRRVG